MGSQVRLAWKCLFTSNFSRTDQDFGMRSLLISSSVHARLQVSVCSGYDLRHPD